MSTNAREHLRRAWNSATHRRAPQEKESKCISNPESRPGRKAVGRSPSRMTTFVREPIWPMRCFNHSSHPEESVPMIETLSTQSRELLESSQVTPGPRYWAGDSRPTLPAGIVFQANLQDGTENAVENWHLALGLAQNQIPLRLVPLDPIEEAQPLLPESVREGLKHLALQRVDPASSVIYQ